MICKEDTGTLSMRVSRIRDAGQNFVLQALYVICKKDLQQQPHIALAVRVVNQFNFHFRSSSPILL
jgi:hypothetical protein